jgi:hypothetical protein
VRIHRGPEAGALAASLGARAFAYGDRVVLGARVQQGEDADRTLGHELAHVAQQARSGRAVVQRDGDDVLPPDTVVVVNAPPSVTGDEPLANWPALGAVLDDYQYAELMADDPPTQPDGFGLPCHGASKSSGAGSAAVSSAGC